MVTFLCLSLDGVGQNWCGFVPDPHDMHPDDEWANYSRSTSNYCLPMRFFVFQEDDCTGETVEDLVFGEIMVHLEQNFAPEGIKFYMPNAPTYICNSDLYFFEPYTADSWQDVIDAIEEFYPNDAINVIIPGNVIGASGGLGGLSQFPADLASKNAFAVSHASMNSPTSAKNVTIHELGHYLDLHHTHSGGNENVTREEGSSFYNCEYTGDFICDTPAEPESWVYTSPGEPPFNFETCVYYGSEVDAEGLLYEPDVQNIMGYWGLCSSQFTPGQFERMCYGIDERLEHSNYSLDAPSSGATVTSLDGYADPYGEVHLSWDDHPDAYFYLIERSTDGFAEVLETIDWAESNEFVDNSVASESTYQYRVRPITGDCDGYSPIISITTCESYCKDNATCTYLGLPNYIDGLLVELAGNQVFLNQETGCDGGIHFDPDELILLQANNTYDITITQGEAGDGDRNALHGSIWLDLDKSGTFEPAEQVGSWTGSQALAANPLQVTIDIPSTAFNGKALLRFKTSLVPSQVDDACDNVGFGETEDYWVELSGGDDCQILSLYGSAGMCDPATGTYTATLSINSALDLPATGTINGFPVTIEQDQSLIEVSGFPADGDPVSIVTSFNGCEQTFSGWSLTPPPCEEGSVIWGLQASSGTSCDIIPNGWLQIDFSGGTMPLTFELVADDGTIIDTQVFESVPNQYLKNDIPADSYTLSFEDSSDPPNEGDINYEFVELTTMVPTIDDVVLCEEGIATLDVDLGFTDVYWFTGETTESIEVQGYHEGSRYVNTIDGQGCQATTYFEIIDLQCSGCTNPIACNYVPEAYIEDGSCVLPDGCTDIYAANYDVDAECDDGSCIYAGCTDPEYCNYDPIASIEDGSCSNDFDAVDCPEYISVNSYQNCNPTLYSAIDASSSDFTVGAQGNDVWIRLADDGQQVMITCTSMGEELTVELWNVDEQAAVMQMVQAAQISGSLVDKIYTSYVSEISVIRVVAPSDAQEFDFELCVEELPLGVLTSSYVGSTQGVCGKLKCNYIGESTNYQWQLLNFTAQAPFDPIIEYESTGTSFHLNQVQGLLEPGATYFVAIAPEYPFLTPIMNYDLGQVFTVDEISTQLPISYEGGNYGLWNNIKCNYVCGAEGYQFKLSSLDGSFVVEHDNGSNTTTNLNYNNYPGLVLDEEYEVQVAVEYGGIYHDYGDPVTICFGSNCIGGGGEAGAFDSTSEDFQFAVAPNPIVGSNVNLQFHNLEAKILNVRIYAADGRLVFDRQFASESTQQLSLNTDLGPGMYLININTESGQQSTSRFLVKE